jgi:hypothetical protein
LVFLAEAQIDADRLDDAARTAEAARDRFEAKGNVVSAARAADLVSSAREASPA